MEGCSDLVNYTRLIIDICVCFVLHNIDICFIILILIYLTSGLYYLCILEEL